MINAHEKEARPITVAPAVLGGTPSPPRCLFTRSRSVTHVHLCPCASIRVLMRVSTYHHEERDATQYERVMFTRLEFTWLCTDRDLNSSGLGGERVLAPDELGCSSGSQLNAVLFLVGCYGQNVFQTQQQTAEGCGVSVPVSCTS